MSLLAPEITAEKEEVKPSMLSELEPNNKLRELLFRGSIETGAGVRVAEETKPAICSDPAAGANWGWNGLDSCSFLPGSFVAWSGLGAPKLGPLGPLGPTGEVLAGTSWKEEGDWRLSTIDSLVPEIILVF